MQNLVAVWAYVADPKIGGPGAPLLWDRGGAWPSRNAFPDTCYHIEFGRFRSNDVISTGVPKTEKAWARPSRSFEIEDRVDPQNTPLPQVCYHAEFDRSMPNDLSVRSEILRKNLCASHIPAFKVTQGHQNWRGAIR